MEDDGNVRVGVCSTVGNRSDSAEYISDSDWWHDSVGSSFRCRVKYENGSVNGLCWLVDTTCVFWWKKCRHKLMHVIGHTVEATIVVCVVLHVDVHVCPRGTYVGQWSAKSLWRLELVLSDFVHAVCYSFCVQQVTDFAYFVNFVSPLFKVFDEPIHVSHTCAQELFLQKVFEGRCPRNRRCRMRSLAGRRKTVGATFVSIFFVVIGLVLSVVDEPGIGLRRGQRGSDSVRLDAECDFYFARLSSDVWCDFRFALSTRDTGTTVASRACRLESMLSLTSVLNSVFRWTLELLRVCCCRLFAGCVVVRLGQLNILPSE